MIDKKGNFFNKESILENLIEKSIPNEYSHINTIKDLK